MTDSWKLTSTDRLTLLARRRGANTWQDLTRLVSHLPYGRNSKRDDFGLVIEEMKGSCSSKHALLKAIADANSISKVELILGIYKMNRVNTPRIEIDLSDFEIDYIPEAHCYLKVNGERMDYTTYESQINLIEKDIIEELEIEPMQIVDFKVDYHKSYLSNWLDENGLDMGIDEIWILRERCIENLAKNNPGTKSGDIP